MVYTYIYAIYEMPGPWCTSRVTWRVLWLFACLRHVCLTAASSIAHFTNAEHELQLSLTSIGCMHAVTALDSSGETAKQVAESKKWLAIAALIPDQSSRESASAQPHPNNSNHPVLAGNHASTTTPVSQLDQPQLPSDPEQVTPSAADIDPQQMPVGCSQSEDSTGQRAASSTSATGAPFPSSHRGTSHDATGAGLPCQAGNGPQQQPVWQPTPGQEGLSCQLSSCASRQTPNDAGSSSTDVHPPQPCPAKAQRKA